MKAIGCVLFLDLFLHLLAPTALEAAAARPAPPLPAPSGIVVNVATEAQLQAAVSALASNTTIMLAPGVYTLTNTLYINGTFTNVALRGSTLNSDDVVLQGPGMTNASYGNVPFGVWVGGSVQGITIANLTIRDLYYHPIILNAGTQSPHIYNVHLINAGQQFVKSNPDNSGGGVNNGLVEYAVIEYVTASRDSYTNGVDVHTGQNWVIRNSLFRNIRAPQGQLAGPVILMWNGSSNSIADGNTFIDCQREIAFGLIERVTPHDQSGGIVRNNFIYRSASVAGDVGIGVFDSPNTQVLQNTALISGTYQNAVEYRFVESTGVVIANNLLDAAIQARDGASGAVTNNYLSAAASMFVNAAAGDLHLVATDAAVIGKVPTLQNALLDWDGDARPLARLSDYGADEFSAGSLPTAPVNMRIVRH
ncbi:MAG TPA: hypothetical protein VGY48_14745 [Vicinamibacterales bacterium]|jgi:hypothetical protein|nr:hypothetical protein [Vicinamibacterales bacterium]